MPSEVATALRRLGVALINATLLLIVAALILAVTLVVQLRGLATEMREGLRTELTAMQPQLQAVREQARAALDASPAPETRAELQALVDQLDALDPATVNTPVADTLLRQIVIALLSSTARAMAPP